MFANEKKGTTKTSYVYPKTFQTPFEVLYICFKHIKKVLNFTQIKRLFKILSSFHSEKRQSINPINAD